MTPTEIQYASLLEGLTDSLPKDCIWDEEGNRIIIVTNPGQIGKVIGKGGETIRRIRERMQKDIDVVEFSEKAERFAINTLTPAKVRRAKLLNRGGKEIIQIFVSNREKGRAIGKGGRNIARARLLLKRHFNIDDITVTTE